MARRVLANQRRGDGRRSALGERLRRQLATVVRDTADEVVQKADVSGAAACGWIAEFGRAKDAGSESRMTAATDALQASKHWPILLEMDARGDYSEVVWDYAEEVAAGSVPEGYRQGLGC